ncbi:MAG: hypothetical protein LLG08_05210 [Actinomycetia bacterium]|nr:hypothetical protein [Actinomycetes bacterium]
MLLAETALQMGIDPCELNEGRFSARAGGHFDGCSAGFGASITEVIAVIAIDILRVEDPAGAKEALEAAGIAVAASDALYAAG